VAGLSRSAGRAFAAPAAGNNGVVGLHELVELARVCDLKRNESDFAVALNRTAATRTSKVRTVRVAVANSFKKKLCF
jgi:hypothetical protein